MKTNVDYKYMFSLNDFTDFSELSDWKYLSLKRFKPTAPNIRD